MCVYTLPSTSNLIDQASTIQKQTFTTQNSNQYKDIALTHDYVQKTAEQMLLQLSAKREWSV